MTPRTLWLLLDFVDSHHGLWWTCLPLRLCHGGHRARVHRVGLLRGIVIESCAERLLAVVAFPPLVLCPSFLACRATRGSFQTLAFVVGFAAVDLLFGSCVPLGWRGIHRGQALQETGLGLHAIDVIEFFHPFRY